MSNSDTFRLTYEPIAQTRRVRCADLSASARLESRKSSHGGPYKRSSAPSPLPSFSLVEVMIAIVILGVGLTMVATMFPVAWDRARTMSEFTTQQSMLPAIETNLTTLVSVSGPSMNGAGFAGDLIFDRDYPPTPPCTPGFIVRPSDTRVHVLNMQNVRVASAGRSRGYVKEDSWRLERMPEVDSAYTLPWVTSAILDDATLTPGPDFLPRSYDSGLKNPLETRIAFHQRVHPPLLSRPVKTVNVSSGDFLQGTGTDAQQAATWEQALDTRRFCWGVLHRLRGYVGPKCLCDSMGVLNCEPCPDAEPCCLLDKAEEAISKSRSFDFYFVTLRRANPANRYAVQDPGDRGQFVPDPCSFTASTNLVPRPKLDSEDVVLPTPWRVQIALPGSTGVLGSLNPRAQANGIPTEVTVPPQAVTGITDPAKHMWVSMFPTGSQFVDELTGTVYRVTTRRVSADNTSATLTLDKEITIEDVDLEANDPRCASCATYDPGIHNIADPEELLRTVWVYPPPVATRTTGSFVLFDGNPPVVGIDVRTISLAPTDH